MWNYSGVIGREAKFREVIVLGDFVGVNCPGGKLSRGNNETHG